MADKSAIEWTDATWNPVTGCTKVSPGCAHCYAETITLRFKHGGRIYPARPPSFCIPTDWTRPASGVRRDVRRAEEKMHEAVALHLQGLIEDGEPVPESRSFASFIAVP